MCESERLCFPTFRSLRPHLTQPVSLLFQTSRTTCPVPCGHTLPANVVWGRRIPSLTTIATTFLGMAATVAWPTVTLIPRQASCAHRDVQQSTEAQRPCTMTTTTMHQVRLWCFFCCFFFIFSFFFFFFLLNRPSPAKLVLGSQAPTNQVLPACEAVAIQRDLPLPLQDYLRHPLLHQLRRRHPRRHRLPRPLFHPVGGDPACFTAPQCSLPLSFLFFDSASWPQQARRTLGVHLRRSLCSWGGVACCLLPCPARATHSGHTRSRQRTACVFPRGGSTRQLGG